MTIKITTFTLCLMLAGCTEYYKGPKSDHFDGKRFYDPVLDRKTSIWDMLKWRISGENNVWPKKVTVKKYNIPSQRVTGESLVVTNVGHVTFLIQTQGLNILTDPVWSERASPVSFAGPKRVIDPGINFDDLPPIDVVWVSHNHYDHLDLATIDRLWKKFKPRIITPLGNDTIIKSHNSDIKAEAYDWYDRVSITKDITFHLSPMQHWSARGIFDKNKALWAALTIETTSGNIYFVGDSGYGNGRYFKSDYQKFAPYRLALLPMGAYAPRWFMKYAHMDPEEFILAHLDLGAPITVPSHYDVFKLTNEGRGDALIKLAEAKKKHSVDKSIKVMEVGESLAVPRLAESH